MCIISFNPYLGFGGVERFLQQYALFLEKKGVNYRIINIREYEPERANVFYHMALAFKAMLGIIVLSRHERIYQVHCQDVFYTSIVGLVAAKVLNVPLIIHCHNLPHNILFSINKVVLSKAAYSVEKALLKFADAIITLTEDLKRQLITMGVKSQKIRVIPIGLNLKRFQVGNSGKSEVRKEINIPSTDFVIGFVGRLSKEKNVQSLLTAFAKLHKMHKVKNCTLLFIGDGPERELLFHLSKQYDLSERVILTGARKDVERLLTIMDVFVLPSYTEGLPYSLLEAMTTEKAIITSNIPAIHEIVRHGEEAILVNPHNVEELEQAILSLYNNPDLRAKLGRKARERAKLYDVNRVYEQILKTYEELVRLKAG